MVTAPTIPLPVVVVLSAIVTAWVFQSGTKVDDAPAPELSIQNIAKIVARADRLTGAGRLTEASREYDRALTTSGLNSGAKRRLPLDMALPLLFNSARLQVDLGRLERAKSLFERVLDLLSTRTATQAIQASLADVHQQLAAIATKERDHKAAVSQWSKAVSMSPNDADFQFSLGSAIVAAREANFINLALEAYKAAAKLDPSRPKHHYFVASTFELMNKSSSDQDFTEEIKANVNAALNAAKNAHVAELYELGAFSQKEHPKFALELFRICIMSRKMEKQTARAVTYSAGRILAELGVVDEEKKLYERAVKAGIFVDARQRPMHLIESLTPASGPWPGNDMYVALQQAIEMLESSTSIILQELQLSNTAAINQVDHLLEEGFNSDLESLATLSDHWLQGVLVRGGKIHDDFRASGQLKQTFSLVDNLLEKDNVAHKLPLGAVEISILKPGAHLVRHCGPTNHRIRLHLGLAVPKKAVISVGGEERSWMQGKVLLIDDSFEHEVWNNGSSARIVLIVDVWHPRLSLAEREKIRKMEGQMRQADH